MPTLNPFTPTFGKVPPYVAGREDVLADMAYAFENGSGDPNLATVLIGPRGVGKTALLSLIADEALRHGWIGVSVSAMPGMLDDILIRAQGAAREHVEHQANMRVKEVGIPQLLSVTFDSGEEQQGNWRSKMDSLLDQLEARDIGLLITIDEVTVNLDEMVQFASIYQHFVTEDRKIGLVMAGLPYNVSRLISDERISFLRRARQRYLAKIPDADIENALVATVEEAGKAIDDDALKLAVQAIEGYPYMMQLVGYRSWAASRGDTISLMDVQRGVAQAMQELKEGVVEATYFELSPTDIRFCEAMLDDAQTSTLSDIAGRMNVKSNYASEYKRRLLVAGVISERYGRLEFVIPGFREYVAECKA